VVGKREGDWDQWRLVLGRAFRTLLCGREWKGLLRSVGFSGITGEGERAKKNGEI